MKMQRWEDRVLDVTRRFRCFQFWDQTNADTYSDGGGSSSIVDTLIGSASQVASAVITANNQPAAPALYSPYGTRTPGFGVVANPSSGIMSFLLIGVLVVGGIFAIKAFRK